MSVGVSDVAAGEEEGHALNPEDCLHPLGNELPEREHLGRQVRRKEINGLKMSLRNDLGMAIANGSNIEEGKQLRVLVEDDSLDSFAAILHKRQSLISLHEETLLCLYDESGSAAAVQDNCGDDAADRLSDDDAGASQAWSDREQHAPVVEHLRPRGDLSLFELNDRLGLSA